jgi:hypothetical protein
VYFLSFSCQTFIPLVACFLCFLFCSFFIYLFIPLFIFYVTFLLFFLHFPSVFSRGTEGLREVVDIYRRWILKRMSMCAAEGTGWNRLKINSVSGFYEN